MHRGVRDKLEDILAGGHPGNGSFAGYRIENQRHLDECADCRDEVAAMQEQRRLLQTLRPPDEAEPRAGFYARVIERIEAQGATSIWSLFFDSVAGRGLAMASMVLALSVGAYLITSERGAEPAALRSRVGGALTMPDSGGMLSGSPDHNAVLWNLVTYREQ
jgi:anti-sigma factor RsiW